MKSLPQALVSLIHYVELSNSGWSEQTIDKCVLGILWYIKIPAPVQKIKKEIFDELGLDLKPSQLFESLTRLIEKGEVVRLTDGRLKLSPAYESFLSKEVEQSKILEKTVKTRFRRKILDVCPNADAEKIWESFIKKLLIPLVSDSGARTFEFFFSHSSRNTQSVALTDEFLDELPEEYRDALSKAISDFINPTDQDITKFVFSYLSAYLAISSTGLSKKITKKLHELRENPAEFEIYVDTNFIYSILGLHDNPANMAAQDLLEMAQAASDNVVVKFVVNPITLDETQNSINSKKIILENITYPPNLARAAADSNISGLYKSFFENASQSEHGKNPYDYFSIYEKHLVRILEEKNISVANNEKTAKYFNYLDVITDTDNQVAYEQKRYKGKAKSEAKITNDVVLWHYVKDLREKPNALPIDSKFWIVTVDYRFITFDRYKSDQLKISPVCMLPSQLIQIIRFFSPSAVDFEKIMMSTLRFPLLMKDYDQLIERIALKITRQLAKYEGIENLSVKTLQNIITDEGLQNKLIDNNLNEAEEAELIHERVTREIVEYEIKLRDAEKKIDENTKASEEIAHEFEKTRERFEKEKDVLVSQIEELRVQAERERQERIDEKKEIEGKKSLRNFLLLSGFSLIPYILIFPLIILFVKRYTSDPWLIYGITSTVVYIASILMINLLIRLGKRDDYIKNSEIFKNIDSKLRWRASLSLAISFLWFGISALLEELIIRNILP